MLVSKSKLNEGALSHILSLRAALKSLPVPAYFSGMDYCTDNAAMIAGLADIQYREQAFAGLDLDAITYSQFRR